jgi:hypothetical protein
MPFVGEAEGLVVDCEDVALASWVCDAVAGVGRGSRLFLLSRQND